MKHGPIALIDARVPVFVLVPKDRNHERALSNLHEAKAREARVIDGMSVGEIEAEMFIHIKEKDRRMEGVLYVQECARVAHRLAQPVPVVDPDAEAKRLCWTCHSAAFPEDYKDVNDCWEDRTEMQRIGWRAAAKGDGA
jgi:hypothetical protein